MRTQSKYSKNRKSGGLRTLRECGKCNIKTRGIWKCKGKLYCYKCYKEVLDKMGSAKSGEAKK